VADGVEDFPFGKRWKMGLFRTIGQREEKQDDAMVRVPGNTPDEISTRMVLDEATFMSMLYLERRRAERAQRRYVLLLVDVKDAISGKQKISTVQKITRTLCEITRETDLVGWYVTDHLLGVIATEIGKADSKEVRESISAKFRAAFSQVLGQRKASQITVSFHFFPEEREDRDLDDSQKNVHYPDLSRKKVSRKLALGFKRAIDIAGSAFALIVLAPLFGLIALAIKLTSEGPVLFTQERLGQCGKKFKFLKFRSMQKDCDCRIHQEYVSKFIAGQVSGQNGNAAAPTFKLQSDPRVTPVGSILRKTSLDELPQFWNVLVGEMSLVGPRPPLEYEFKAYDVWHRRRVLEIKPGITGLWQVEGRSRTHFDDMVRLDLKYARGWSLWLDLKILLRTPAAVVSGNGAR
jgi:lipopolysaccharide/colanic/teichoic acid biosynthesis glycosyltransferase